MPRPEPLVPAGISYQDGVLHSDTYGDVYHSASGGLAQAHHVFLAGNELPGRWRGRERFVILETGFGFGLNFLATWQAWREDAQRCARLHFVSIEKHPFAAADLKSLHEVCPGLAQLAPLAAQLQARWPLLVPGVHRLSFDDERVILTLAFGDVAHVLPQLRLAADALYLDGFAPPRNAQMWSPELLRGLARRCAPRATAATWSVAAPVREALVRAGFEVAKRPGLAPKREMTVARLREGVSRIDQAQRHRERSAIVIGAGIAGASAAERLCARGWAVTLIERNAEPAQGASGNAAALFHPVVTRDDNHLARLSRAGCVAALSLWKRLDQTGITPRRSHCGVLQLARDEREAKAQHDAFARLAFPAAYAELVDRERAGRIAGVELAAGGIWFPQAGWIDPRSLTSALLAASGPRLTRRFRADVAAIERDAGTWRALNAAGAELARAPVLVLANASEALRLAPSESIQLRSVRGQLTHLPAAHAPILNAAVLRGGFILPPIEGSVLVGASFDLEDADDTLRADSHEGNLERMQAILPRSGGWTQAFDAAALAGRVGFRAVAPDRLPLVGALPDEEAIGRSADRLSRVPRKAGLYGAFAYASRGIVWSALAGELIASLLENEPLALDDDLVGALDPARFALRALRRKGTLHASAPDI